MAYTKVNWNTLSTITQAGLSQMDDGIATLDARLTTEINRLPNIANIHAGFTEVRPNLKDYSKAEYTVSLSGIVKSTSCVFLQVVSSAAIYANPTSVSNGSFHIVLQRVAGSGFDYSRDQQSKLRINYLIVNSGT